MIFNKLFLIVSLIIFSAPFYGQNFDVDGLIKMRDMDKSTLDEFIKSKNDSWNYQGYDNSEHIWTLQTPVETNNIVLILRMSLKNDNENEISIITGDSKIVNNIEKQIENYNMKLLSSKTEGTGNNKILREVYEGANYLIQVSKTRDNNGHLMSAILLIKK